MVDPREARDYAWFLGAGASKSSGVALAWEILRDAKRELFSSVNGRPANDDSEIDTWLKGISRLQDRDHAYSDALEWLLPRPRQRRNWLLKYLEDATPSPGYLGLVELARRDLVRIVLTTNFDDLVQQAMSRGGPRQRLREVAHDQAAADFEWPPKLFTLLKLHGDFLFDSIRNTRAEVERLETNQAEKLHRSASDGGLVVVGYGGGDESIMSVLDDLGDVPLGLYWLHLPGDRPNDRIRSLLRNDWASSVEIGGFDEFVALVTSKANYAGRAGALMPAVLPMSPSARFVSGARVSELLSRVMGALGSSSERVCAITGLPGVGKTALARHAAERTSADFEQTVALTAQRRGVDLASALDTTLRALGLPASSDIAQAQARLLDELGSRPILLVLDNLDSVTLELADLLRLVPAPSRALVTVRDPAGLREAGVAFREVRHDGLSTDELRDMLRLHAEASPRIAERINALGDTEVQHLLQALRGWPQALVLVIGQLDDPLADVSSAATLTAGGDLVQRLLSDGYETLSAEAKRVLGAAAAFDATLTPEGARSVSVLGDARSREGLATLLERRWLLELGPRTYAFAHPLVEEFVRSLRDRRSSSRRSRALGHLERWLARYGGQPDPEWSNFRELDREFENVRAALEDALRERALKRMTDMMRPAFSYSVERGHWSWTDALARRALAARPSAGLRAEWLVWRSWLALYLRLDPNESARLAEEALATNTNRRRPRFEAHRRALTALARTGDFSRARRHAADAEKLRPTLGRRDSDEGIDLLNAVAALDLHEGHARGRPTLVRRALAQYREAYDLCSSRAQPNTRELGIALLGQARALRVLGEDEDALDTALRAVKDAGSIRWLRGQEEGNHLVAELADDLGRPDMARAARAFADATGAALRRAS
ncbi:MAG TPA: SIR2 family protein [Thermoleophilaceae bacterium]|nr:SIR2 family protein [Thermoleophilaceae bacterium]